MPTVFIFHGVDGDSRENWFPWLAAELTKKGFTAIVPDFPHANHPVLPEWLEHFRKFEDQVDDQTVFVGHSLGAAFALRLLERMQKPLCACFLVAPVSGVMGNQFDPVMKTFTGHPFDWKTIRRNAKHFSVIHSDNDPYIKLSQAEELAKHLGTTVTLVRGGGHFNASAGYAEFPLLLEQITALP